MRNNGSARVGVDIGGTFTDLVLSYGSGSVLVEKVLTTPADPSRAVLVGLTKLLARTEVGFGDLSAVIHGTTLVSNAILERKGAKVGLLTTRGFRDVLEIGKEFRYELYDLNMDKAQPLVPRLLRMEIGERTLSNGHVETPLDEEQVRQAGMFFRERGVESAVVCFLNSYVNPAHEKRAGDVLRDVLGETDITLSSDVAPVIREFERFSTAAANAYVRPLVRRYLDQLRAELGGHGFAGQLHLMASNGGVVGVEEAADRPVLLAESGPAAGAVAASRLARENSLPHVLSFDMGGTTAKICFIDNGTPTRTGAFEVARVQRFKRGSGLPLQVPVIQMIEIGAGGGSIARIDRMGLLKVGPESTGADPGPACYGAGGEAPAVTDADLVLGYLDPHYFLGGQQTLDKRAAERAIESVARPLGLSVVEGASGIHEVVNTHMATAARVHAAETGRDIRRYAVMAFGGAGPVHAYGLSRALGVSQFICPVGAGVTSAVGLLTAPPVIERSRSHPVSLEQVDTNVVRDIYAQLSDEVRRIQGDTRNARQFKQQYLVEMRYEGQGYEISVPIPFKDFEEATPDRFRKAFEREYRRLFGHLVQGPGIEIISWRLVLSGKAPANVSWQQGSERAADRSAKAKKGTRPVYFREAGDFLTTPVYDRYRLDPGQTIQGPAVVEERESTTVIGPRARLAVDEELNLVVTVAVEVPELVAT